MTPTKKPFADLQNDLSWFHTCPELRVLHIATSGVDRPLVVAQVAMSAAHALNRSPFFLLEDAHTRLSDGWEARALRVREIHEARREGMPELDQLPPGIEARQALSTFGAQLVKALAAHAKLVVLDGALVALAPGVLEEPAAFVRDIVAIAKVPGLARVRFIVIELGDDCREPLQKAFEDAFFFNVCVVDPAARREEAKRQLGAGAAAPAGASPEVAAGFAGPRDVVAPPRYGKPAWGAALTPEAKAILEKELGPPAALAGPMGAELRRAIKGAAFAAQEERWPDTAKLQLEAIALCTKAGLNDLSCVLEISLGGYLLHAGLQPRSRATFEAAAARARMIDRPDLVAQALLGLAAVLVLERNVEAAVSAYRRAGEAAEEANLAILAIEAYRTAGQVSLRAGAEPAATAAWKRALKVAQAGDPKEIAASSAPAAARALAKVVQGHGSDAAAAALLDDAERMERAARGRTGAADVRG